MTAASESVSPCEGSGSVAAIRRPLRVTIRQQRLDLRLEGAAVEAHLDRRRGALEPVEVLDEGIGAAPVEPQDLEGAVAAIEAVVAEGDERLGGGGDASVDAG